MKFIENDYKFQLLITKESLMKSNQVLVKQIKEMQSNLVKLAKTNETLNSDLQTASKTIVSMKNTTCST